MIKGLAQFLRSRRSQIVRKEDVGHVVESMTYGDRTEAKDLEIIDFDALMEQIEQFEKRDQVMTSPVDLPPIPESSAQRGDTLQHNRADMHAYALAARAYLEEQVKHLRTVVEEALRERNEYESGFRALKTSAAMQLARIRELEAHTPTTRLEHWKQRAEAAEVRVREFQEALNTAQHCIVEAETERDALHTQIEAIRKQPTVVSGRYDPRWLKFTIVCDFDARIPQDRMQLARDALIALFQQVPIIRTLEEKVGPTLLIDEMRIRINAEPIDGA